MNRLNFTVLVAILTIITSPVVFSQDMSFGALNSEYKPEIHGTIRAKYEYEHQINKGRFEIRNARLNVEGKVIPIVCYKAEIDLSDEGAIKMLDAYIRIIPKDFFKFTIGQMRVPFTIDAHRSPHLQFFANRSFIAKQVGNVRDVGAAISLTIGHQLPITLEGGIFNGSGLVNQKNFWTKDYNFSFKVQTLIMQQLNVTLSCQKATAGKNGVMMYNAGTFWENHHWHFEAEYLRKIYVHNSFKPVNAIDIFTVYKFPLKKHNVDISLLGRYDYMSNHNNGGTDENGNLKIDDPKRHRFTGGVTLSLGKKSLQADIRLNYEQYFYASVIMAPISEQNKIVAEFVVHF